MHALQTTNERATVDAAALFISRFSDAPAGNRRAHAVAYGYWLSLCQQGQIPSISDFDALQLGELGAKSILLEVTDRAENAQIRYLGRTLRAISLDETKSVSDTRVSPVLDCLEGGLAEAISVGDARALEVEVPDCTDKRRCWITLLPLRSAGTSIDFVYALITLSGRTGKGPGMLDLTTEMRIDGRSTVATPGFSFERLGPTKGEGRFLEMVHVRKEAFTISSITFTERRERRDDCIVQGLVARLDCARSKVGMAIQARARSRAALCEALSNAYDFSLAANANEDLFLQIVADAGLEIDAFSIVGVVKLIFGSDYDEERITEAEKILSWAHSNNIPAGALLSQLEAEGEA